MSVDSPEMLPWNEHLIEPERITAPAYGVHGGVIGHRSIAVRPKLPRAIIAPEASEPLSSPHGPDR